MAGTGRGSWVGIGIGAASAFKLNKSCWKTATLQLQLLFRRGRYALNILASNQLVFMRFHCQLLLAGMGQAFFLFVSRVSNKLAKGPGTRRQLATSTAATATRNLQLATEMAMALATATSTMTTVRTSCSCINTAREKRRDHFQLVINRSILLISGWVLLWIHCLLSWKFTKASSKEYLIKACALKLYLYNPDKPPLLPIKWNS